MPQARTRSAIGPRQVAPITGMTRDELRNYQALSAIGINLDPATLRLMLSGTGFDAADGAGNTTVTPATISNMVQFLQTWLPGQVEILTAARMIDTLVGITTAGSWEDESIVQRTMEATGMVAPYGDHTNIPLASYNPSFTTRDIVRGEAGIEVGRLQEQRAAKMEVNAAADARRAATLVLEIFRNRIGFFGFNDGNSRIYGILNDPGLLPWVTLPANAAGTSTEWKDKTFLEITADLRLMASQLRLQGNGNIDPAKGDATLAIPLSATEYLTVTNVQGTQSVRQWINENYKNWRIESVPEFALANGGVSGAYLYMEKVENSGTDDNKTFVQVVPAKFQVLGVEKKSKTYIEDFTNATAGVMVKRPFAVVRASGL